MPEHNRSVNDPRRKIDNSLKFNVDWIPETGCLADLPQTDITNSLHRLLNSNGYSAERLIDLIKTDHRLAELLGETAVREGYSIEEHTLMVLREFEKYFAEAQLPAGIGRAEMRLMLVLHDIGKGLDADRSAQSSCTLRVLRDLCREGLFSAETLRLIAAPVSCDVLGHYFYMGTAGGPSVEDKLILAQDLARGKCGREDFMRFFGGIRLESSDRIEELAQEGAGQIREMARRAGMSPKQLLSILVVYYQCDVLAYTFDAQRDPKRSSAPAAARMTQIRFNHDRELKTVPGLEAFAGQRSWEVYARLEREGAFPRARAFPSLDFLFRILDGFDPRGCSIEERMFQFDLEKGRLLFSAPVEDLLDRLLEKL